MTTKKEKLDIEEKIDRYIEGGLNSEEIDALWVQIVQHQEYMDYLQTAANLKEAVRQSDAGAARKNRGWIYAAAAAIVLLVVVLGALQFGYFDSATQVKPIQKIELDYYRSAHTVANASDRKEIITKAIKLFNDGHFDQAVALLNSERAKTKDISWFAELDITLGTFYYNKDKFNEAAFYFADVLKHQKDLKPLKIEKAYWFLGNSYFQMNMIDQAEVQMRKAYKMNGAYSRVAKSVLDAMANVQAQQQKEKG